MKYCNYCGSRITEPVRTCPECGAQLYADTPYVPLQIQPSHSLAVSGPEAPETEKGASSSKIKILLLGLAGILTVFLI